MNYPQFPILVRSRRRDNLGAPLNPDTHNYLRGISAWESYVLLDVPGERLVGATRSFRLDAQWNPAKDMWDWVWSRPGQWRQVAAGNDVEAIADALASASDRQRKRVPGMDTHPTDAHLPEVIRADDIYAALERHRAFLGTVH